MLSELLCLTRDIVQVVARGREVPAALAGVAAGYRFPVVAEVAGSSEEAVGSPMPCKGPWILPTAATEARGLEPGTETC